MLVGVATCVTDQQTDRRRFSGALRILDLALAKTCQDFCIAFQSSELEALQGRLEGLRAIRASMVSDQSAGRPSTGRSVVDRALDYIAAHYLERQATLKAISNEMGVTEKYLTHRFTAVVGQHMHAYVLQLRVQHACRMILLTEKSIKQVAYDSGFNGADAFRRAFRRYVGVAPGVYRSAFAEA